MTIEIDREALKAIVEQLTADLGLNHSDRLFNALVGVEDAYPPTDNFDPEQNLGSSEEYAIFKAVSAYNLEQLYLVKNGVRLNIVFHSYADTLLTIKQMVLSGKTFTEIMAWLLEGVYTFR